MKKIISSILIAATLSSIMGVSTFALNKEECEADSSCLVYDGVKIPHSYKNIFIPRDKRDEFQVERQVLQLSAERFNFIKTALVSFLCCGGAFTYNLKFQRACTVASKVAGKTAKITHPN